MVGKVSLVIVWVVSVVSVIVGVKGGNSATLSTCTRRPQRLTFLLQNNARPVKNDFLDVVSKTFFFKHNCHIS